MPSARRFSALSTHHNPPGGSKQAPFQARTRGHIGGREGQQLKEIPRGDG